MLTHAGVDTAAGSAGPAAAALSPLHGAACEIHQIRLSFPEQKVGDGDWGVAIASICTLWYLKTLFGPGRGREHKYTAPCMQDSGEAGGGGGSGVAREDLAGGDCGVGSEPVGGVPGPWHHGCRRRGRQAQDRAGSRVRFGR